MPGVVESLSRIERVIAWVEAAIVEGAEGDAAAERSLRSAVLPAMQVAREVPAWPPVALPLAVGDALGLDPEVTETLGAACVLFFASADVVDDAQDGDLDPAHWRGWQPAITAGLTLLFLSHQIAVATAPAEQRGVVAAAFGAAGMRMCLGQRLDLAQQAPLAAVGAEDDYLACARAKTGASIALFTSLPAMVAGAPAAVVEGLEGWGYAMGCALQLASDMTDATDPDSRDRRAGRVTLPVQRAWVRLASPDRALLEASWRGDPEAPSLDFLLQRTGALAYVRARIGALKLEAREALMDSGAPPALVEALAAWTERAGGGEPQWV